MFYHEERHKEIMSIKTKDSAYSTKQEEGNSNNVTTVASSSSGQQLGFKNPRIVRVSRNFGGKDRHSKVYTVKGLRDRRIRLSVPTAIQLYDLQGRLGLSQPSKAIDWLLHITKNDIDKLPPLPIIPGIYNSFQGYEGAPSLLDENLVPLSKRNDINVNNSLRTDDLNEDERSISKISSQVFAQNFFPMERGDNASSIMPPSHPSLLNNSMFNNYYHWGASSNLSLAQFGTLGLPPQMENVEHVDLRQFNNFHSNTMLWNTTQEHPNDENHREKRD